MLKKGGKGPVATVSGKGLNKIDLRFSLEPSQIGEGWKHIVPDKIKLSEERPYVYREVKGFTLEDASLDKMSQLLIVLFDYGDEDGATEAFKEIGKGLESEMPKMPNVGDESVVYELELMHSIRMKIMAFRYGKWLVIFTLWLFKEHEVEDTWVKELMDKQLSKIKGWSSK